MQLSQAISKAAKGIYNPLSRFITFSIICLTNVYLNIKKGFPNGPGFRYGNFFIPRANFKVFYNPRDEEISIPETNGQFGKPIPV